MNFDINFEITKNKYTLRNFIYLPIGHSFFDADIKE